MKSFRLINVKSFDDTDEIELKPVTVFVGPNSSGKSSLLRFPIVMGQTFLEETISPVIFDGKYIDYGNFEDVVRNHHSDSSINFYLKYSLKDLMKYPLQPMRPNFHKKIFEKYYSASLDVKIKKKIDKIFVSNYKFLIDNEVLFSLEKESDKYILNINYYIKNEELIKFDEPLSFFLVKPVFDKFLFLLEFPFSVKQEDINSMFENIVKNRLDYNINEYSGISDILNQTLPNTNRIDKDNPELSTGDEKLKEHFNSMMNTLFFTDAVTNAISNYMKQYSRQILYIGPFRTSPKRIYRQSESLHEYVGISGEHSGMLLKQAERDKHPSFEKVSDWFSGAMGYKIKIEEIPESSFFSIKMFTEKNPNGDNLIDVGFGISQILPIIVQMYYDKEQEDRYQRTPFSKYSPENYFIEQPEIHLHPSAQAELANLFVEKITGSKNRVQIFIETHSEHLIRRLQSLVADPYVSFNSNDIAIYYVDMKEDGNSFVKHMELNANGQFKGKWPSGFFDKAYLLSRELTRNA